LINERPAAMTRCGLGNLSEELHCFIQPGRVKGALYFQGGAATGIQFGRSQVVARLYNKTLETKEKGNEAYAKLLTACCGETFNPLRLSGGWSAN
jgi:hypothetical protein